MTVVINPVKTINTEIVSQTIKPNDICPSIQKVIVHFLNKLEEANFFLEHHILVSSAIVINFLKNIYCETSEDDETREYKRMTFRKKFSHN